MDVDPVLSPLVAVVTDGARRKRDTQRAKRQFNAEETEAAAEERDAMSQAEVDTTRVVEEEEEGTQSTAGSAFNPENPYHVSTDFVNNTVYDKQDSRAGEIWINFQEAGTEA